MNSAKHQYPFRPFVQMKIIVLKKTKINHLFFRCYNLSANQIVGICQSREMREIEYMEACNIKRLHYCHREEKWKKQLQIPNRQRNEPHRVTYSIMQLSKITIQGAWQKHDQRVKSRKIEPNTSPTSESLRLS